MRNIIFKTIFLGALCLNGWSGMAQGIPSPLDPLGPVNPAPDRGLPPGNPIDESLLFLLIAGIGLGLFVAARYFKKRAIKN